MKAYYHVLNELKTEYEILEYTKAHNNFNNNVLYPSQILKKHYHLLLPL
jgi:hypothetical protein